MCSENINILTGNPMILGVTKTDCGYNFAFCCDEDGIELKLFKKGEAQESFNITLDDFYKFGSVFCVELSGIEFEQYEYIYSVKGEFVTDPYARYISSGFGFGEDMTETQYRAGIVREEFDWEGDVPLCRNYEDTIIYKLHTRGFTNSSNSKVKNKGTFAGVVEKLPYIKGLGVNAVMLMPPFEFYEYSKKPAKGMYMSPEIKRLNYWGYTEGLYFAPKYAYSKNSKNSDYTVEFKRLVKELHKNDIEVIIELFFAKDTSTSLIMDCVKYWVMEYHIDGVNLCCEANVFENISNEPLLSKTKLFCNYWNEGFVKNYAKSFKNLANLNEGFLVNARRFLKGDEDMLRSFMSSVKSNPSNAANVNYITNHNGFTLADLVSYDRKHNEANGENNADGSDYNYSWNCGVEGKSRKKKVVALRNSQAKNAMLLLLLSQGTPLIMAGDEFLNSQEGNNNPYCQDNQVSWLNWKQLETNGWMTDFVRNVIDFRKKHKILHMQEELKGIDYLSCGYPDISYHSENAWYAKMENYNRHIGVLYAGNYADSDELIYVAYNMHWENHELALPNLTGGKAFEVAISSSEQKVVVDKKKRSVMVPPRSVVVLVSDEVMDK